MHFWQFSAIFYAVEGSSVSFWWLGNHEWLNIIILNVHNGGAQVSLFIYLLKAYQAESNAQGPSPQGFSLVQTVHKSVCGLVGQDAARMYASM